MLCCHIDLLYATLSCLLNSVLSSSLVYAYTMVLTHLCYPEPNMLSCIKGQHKDYLIILFLGVNRAGEGINADGADVRWSPLVTGGACQHLHEMNTLGYSIVRNVLIQVQRRQSCAHSGTVTLQMHTMGYSIIRTVLTQVERR